MKYSVFVLCLCVFPSFIYSQLASPLDAQQNLIDAGRGYNPLSNTIRTFDGRFRGMKGSPFLIPIWQDGTIVASNGDIFQDIQLKYDMEKEELHLKNINGAEVILDRNQVDEFIIYDQGIQYNFGTFDDPKPKKKGPKRIFCQILNEGNVQVLVRRSKLFIPASRDVSSYNNRLYDEYQFRDDKYYIKRGSEKTPVRLKKSRKFLLEYMADHADSIKKYMKDNELLATINSDLMRIISYYNQLAAE